MFLVRSNNSNAVVPGFLLGYHGDAMMPEYSRYMATLPLFAAANAACAATSAYALLWGGDRAVFIAFAIFMVIFSAKMLTQRLVRVSFSAVGNSATSAPFLARMNICLVAVSLAMMGTGYLRMTGEFESVFFDIFGVAMIGLAAACVLALRRSGSGRNNAQ